ncbi:ATP-dependent helicase C-terminal domain-containing protein [Saccharospirillum impatiens]|uniref:ATP-dependent helicase C-terminal domain-containing protein n=1 Tax=Saccharospirillum impatiens TaxID=169438 RepID=UPI00040F1679|nr:ATP-dependent helicase C-terminal domain-containing protein [Saccharospirillum impatiens]
MRPALPVDAIRDAAVSHWQAGGCLVQSPPGSGKTTRLPLWLLEETHQEILLLLPRRLPVKLAAQQLARQLGEAVGQTVGISLRDNTQRSANTRLTVTTYGAFLRRLTRDPELTGVCTVILDEFHERQLDQDTCLTLLHSCKSVFRPDLKLLIMSATLAMDTLHQRLGLPKVESDGQLHPLTTHYRPMRHSDWQTALLGVVEEARYQCDDHVLVFLPGLRDIETINQRLPTGTVTFIVHSQVNNDDLLDQLRTSPAGVILSTNLAESSVTLPRVRCVVDLGRERYARVDPHTDLTELVTRRISKSSADQRAGRAAREGPGLCFRLWSETEHNALAPDQPAEITQADLKPLVLNLADWGLDPGEAFWLTPPNPGRWRVALDQLQAWQAVDASGTQLTDHGRILMSIGLTPALAHLVSLAKNPAIISDALWFAALMSLEQPLPEPVRETFLARVAQGDARLKQEARRLARSLGMNLAKQAEPLPDELLIRAIPQRLVRVDPDAYARLASGRQVRCSNESPKPGWYLLLHGQDQGDSVLAHALWPLDEAAVRSALPETESVRYRPELDRFEAERRLGAFVLSTRPTRPNVSQRLTAWQNSLARTPVEHWPDKASLKPWLDRYLLVRQHLSDDWPDLPTPEALVSWAEPYLAALTKLSGLDTREVLNAWLGYDRVQQLRHLCPSHWTAPSGRNIPLTYTAGANRASADLKLQEAFGLTESPSLINGKLTLTLNLQAPNGRTLASVIDLPHFWSSVYPEIRKEMRGRYNKHPWPTDPMDAPATQATNRQLAKQRSQ